MFKKEVVMVMWLNYITREKKERAVNLGIYNKVLYSILTLLAFVLRKVTLALCSKNP